MRDDDMTVVDRRVGDNPAADLFNAAVAASAISAAWELGVLEVLERDGRLEAEKFALAEDLHLSSLAAILDALATVEVVVWDDERATIATGRRYAEVKRTKGFFHWLSAGCGELLRELAGKTRNSQRVGEFVHRDLAAVSVASREIGREFMQSTVDEVLAGIDFSVVADLGCGSGDLLIRLAKAHPQMRGIGVDISPEALGTAREAVTGAGLDDRISLVEADVTVLRPGPEFERVDLVMGMLVGHDLWPRDACVATLRRLREAFPAAGHLILVDTCRSVDLPDAKRPVFTLGFELVHAFMGKYIPTLEEWHGVFEEGGWRRRATHLIDPPAFTAVFDLVPAV